MSFPKKSIILTLLASILFAGAIASSRAQESPAFTEIVPAETLLYFQVRDITKLKNDFDRSALNAMWKDPELAPVAESFNNAIDEQIAGIEKDLGIGRRELFDMFPGQFAFFLSDYILNITEDNVYQEINTGMIAEFQGSQRRIRDLIEKHYFSDLPRDAERSSEKYRGVDIYTTIYWAPANPDMEIEVQPDNPHAGMIQYHYEYAFVDNVCILLEGQRAYMKMILSNYLARKDGRPAPNGMAFSENFEQTARYFVSRETREDMLAYCNIERLIDQFANTPQFTQNPMLKILDLDEFKSAGWTMNLQKEGIRQLWALAIQENPTGVGRILLHGRRNPFKANTLIPADAVSYANYLLPIQELIEFYKEAERKTNPNITESSIDTGLKHLSELTQVDVQRAIIDRLGSEFAMSIFKGESGDYEDAPRLAFMLALQNEMGVADNLKKMAQAIIGNFMIPFRVNSNQYQGYAIHTIQADPGKNPDIPAEDLPGFSFAVAHSFIIGSADQEIVQKILRQASNGDQPLTRTAAYQDALRNIPQGYTGMVWSNPVFGTMKDIFATYLVLSYLGIDPEGTLPKVDADIDMSIFERYLGNNVSGIYLERDALRIEEFMEFPR